MKIPSLQELCFEAVLLCASPTKNQLPSVFWATGAPDQFLRFPRLAARFSGNARLAFPVLFSKFWDLRTSSSQPNFDSDFCLAGVPLRMTFANYESTFSKPRMDKNTAKLRKGA